MAEIVPVASTRNRGYINDHIDVVPTEASNLKARNKGDPSLRRYEVYFNGDFNVGRGPITDTQELIDCPRRYEISSRLSPAIPLEKALEKAEREARGMEVVLYLLREGAGGADTYEREIVWKPFGWQPKEG